MISRDTRKSRPGDRKTDRPRRRPQSSAHSRCPSALDNATQQFIYWGVKHGFFEYNNTNRSIKCRRHLLKSLAETNQAERFGPQEGEVMDLNLFMQLVRNTCNRQPPVEPQSAQSKKTASDVDMNSAPSAMSTQGEPEAMQIDAPEFAIEAANSMKGVSVGPDLYIEQQQRLGQLLQRLDWSEMNRCQLENQVMALQYHLHEKSVQLQQTAHNLMLLANSITIR